MRNSFLFAGFLLLSTLLFGQKKDANTRFPKIRMEDLQRTVYAVDSNASAVVLYDYGQSKIKGNHKGWFSLEYKRRKRVHILKKAAYAEGDVAIYLYIDGSDEERLRSVKAVTYNLEHGKVVEKRLEKAAVFTDKLDKNHIVKKFTLPNLKEGSIIDFEYTIISDFLFNLQPWSFQGPVPCLWSEYEVSVPQFLGYVFLTQGYQPFFINEKKDRKETFVVTDSRSIASTKNTPVNSTVTGFRWVMKDVPELKEESFTTTLKNHVSKIEFQLSEYRYPLAERKVMNTWQEAAKELMEREDFGLPLTTNNWWLNDDIGHVLAGAVSSLDKAKKIYAFVQDHFLCTDGISITTTQSLKNVLKAKKGTVAELNLLLTAMLRQANIEASPVILSTRDHGYAYEKYPIMSRYNYVISQATIDGKAYHLDASLPGLGFGKLSYECYNGWARMIDEAAGGFNLSADSLKERKTSVLLLANDKGRWSGNFTQHYGYYGSFDLRNKIKAEGQEAFFKQLQKAFGEGVTTESWKTDSLNAFQAPVNLQYKFRMETGGDDILYISPLFFEAWKENPFKAAERHYPVEMPYTIDETFVATIQVPSGYEVEELPKQIMVRLNEKDEGVFEYAIGHSGNIISLRSRVVLNRTFYGPGEYKTLREFFNLIVKKQGEQIVFKKKK
jgi:hypothetical protein